MVKKKLKKEVKKKKSTKKKKDKSNFLIKVVVIAAVLIIAVILAGYFYVQSQKYFSYKGIDFKTTKIGEDENIILFYETLTLLESNDGENAPFGFRIRTKPSELKKVEFENLEDFNLMTLNAYSYDPEYEFTCGGYGAIGMQNLMRTFSKMGSQLILDPNATCDDQGRYNYFYLKYGEETAIKQTGERCYDIIIEGNDESCDILKATEKLMVEMFVKYRDL